MLPKNKQSLYAFVHCRFHEVFGAPNTVEGGGEQWTLKPEAKYASQIHVVLNGTPKGPNVWVFDPHDSLAGVLNTPIVESRHVDEIIDLIQQRLRLANQPKEIAPREPGDSPPPSSVPSESLLALTQRLFRRAFGTPHSVQGGGEQWTLEPGSTQSSAIHILLNGEHDEPNVWVFDPHQPMTGMLNTRIAHASQIDENIIFIQKRVRMANRGLDQVQPK